MNQPASVLIRQSGDTATVRLADPRQNVSTITLTWNRRRALYESIHDPRPCCNAWRATRSGFTRFGERVEFSGSGGDVANCYTQLTASEGTALAEGRKLDLGFLLIRPSWIDDNGEIRRTPGAPDHPRSQGEQHRGAISARFCRSI